ncbi:MAG: VCBS repeat-containing protein [Planctomycetota bacterium]
MHLPEWTTAFAILILVTTHVDGQDLPFRAEEIDRSLKVGYAVKLVDMNADSRLDILVVDSTRVIWFENPNWKLHTIIANETKPDNVCASAQDIDGDGKLDLALGADWRPMDTKTGGTIQWLQDQSNGNAAWRVFPIDEEPTVHRMQWADLDGDGQRQLIVVPLMGRNSQAPDWNAAGVRILSFSIPEKPTKNRWRKEVLNQELHVIHGFEVTDFNGDRVDDLLLASFEGVHALSMSKNGYRLEHIGSGNQQSSPNRGASEVKLGCLAGKRRYVATIEPWHGNQVVVYHPGEKGKLWQRTVLDESLKWGHAVWCANLDGDEDQELVIGVRDNLDGKNLSGVRIYDWRGEGEWRRQLLQPGQVAVEDLAVADLNRDGKDDIVAVGRASHNVVIYWNDRE